jgi:hypothetical protein
MCGITAYLGHRQVLEILLRGLQRLEYRCVSVALRRRVLLPRSPRPLHARRG